MKKIIYLDQNKWIDLARAFYERKDGQKFKETLNYLRDKIDRTEIIMPISIVHLIETAKNEDPEKRKRLASFMVSLSKGYGIVPYIAVRNMEIENAILHRLGQPLKFDIADQTVGKGLSYVVGLDINDLFQADGLDQIRDQINSNPEFAALFMISLIDRDEVHEIIEELEDITDYENEREERNRMFSKEKQVRIGISQMAGDIIFPILLKQLNCLNIDPKGFADGFKNAEEWKSFFFSMPTLDIWTNLHVLRDYDKGKPIHRNDLKDIGFLSVAIPYCDIVVTENYWANVLKNNKYDKRYNCEIITDVNKLKDLL